MTVLHYIFDPLCGWCYGAAPLVQSARRVPELQVAFHGGGMLTGTNRRAITPQWREHVAPHDRRIAQLTGQVFGAAYLEGLLHDAGAVLDSAPPTTAALAAQAVDGRGLDLIHRVQQAHYVEGRRIAELDVLVELAVEIGLPEPSFREAFERLEGAATQRHIADSRRLLAQVGGQGFPTFALEHGDGSHAVLDIGPWLGRAHAWQDHLASLVRG